MTGTLRTAVTRLVGHRLRVGSCEATGQALTLTQCDQTTCGATSVLAAQLLLGTFDPQRAQAQAGAQKLRPVQGLLHEVQTAQHELQKSMNRRAGGPLGPLPWTRLLGSTPWSVAGAMTRTVQPLGDYRYDVHWVRTGSPGWRVCLNALGHSLDAGLPVVLLVGGPLTHRRDGDGKVVGILRSVLGRTPAIPRHYVLAVPAALLGGQEPGWGQAQVYDPASGTVGVLDLRQPAPGTGQGPRELGGWGTVLALISPDVRRTR